MTIFLWSAIIFIAAIWIFGFCVLARLSFDLLRNDECVMCDKPVKHHDQSRKRVKPCHEWCETYY